MEVNKFFDGGGNEVLSSKILGLAKPIVKKAGKDVLRKASALLRYHFKIDPEQLTDEQFSEQWQQLKWALDFEGKRFSLKDGVSSIKI